MITSIHNPIIKQFRALERMRERKKTGLTVLEGFRTLNHAIKNGWKILNILYVPQKMSEADLKTLSEARKLGAYVDEISLSLLEKLSSREGPLGVLAIIEWGEKYTLDTLPLSKSPMILVAESIEKPGNLGVLIRSASAAGADAVVLCASLTSFHEPSCIHSSLGAVFTLPCVTTTTRECLEWLNKNNITPITTTPEGKTSYTSVDFTKPVAIIMGNEHGGVSREFMEKGITAKINMHGSMDSLNVSVAAALFLFEAVRQRALSNPVI